MAINAGKNFVSGALNGKFNASCFAAGTMIETADGDRPIEEIQIGDLVLSANPETGEIAYKPVINTYVHVTDTVLYLTIDEEIIETTEDHPFWVEGQGWTSAKLLQPSDVVWLKDGSTQCVDDIEIVELPEGEYVAVYNFEVADFHTYFVSDYDVLVRNKCKYDTPKVPVEHIGDTKQGKHFHTGMPKGEDMDKKIIFNKKAKNNMRLKLDEFSSFKFEYYFEDKELISTVMKIYEYDTPVFSSIEFGFDNVVYKKWMYNIFFSLNFLNEVALLVEQFDLWCVVNINSYSDFSEEMINLNKDFTIIDIEQDIALDFSSGETNYEIRVINI